MNPRTSIRILAGILVAIMLVGVMPLASFASWEDDNVILDGNKFGTNGYYNVISKKDYVLVPGAAVESDIVLNNSQGSRRQTLHVIEVDPSNPDISILPGYYGIDQFESDPSNKETWNSKPLSETVKYYEEKLGYNVVGAMNTALAYDSNAPFSFLVYNGKVLVDSKNDVNHYHTGVCATMLCVYKNEDGTAYCELRTHEQGLRGDEWQAIGANFGMVVNNGELVYKEEERTSTPAPRSLVGIKEDGTLVLVMNDGRSSISNGLCNYEEGEVMLSLGCKWAFNCDGGGSSTFITKRQGETKLTMRSTPSDGAERATLNSVVIVSNVAPTGELGSVEIESEYEAFAPYSSYTFTASALDTHGYAMDMPEGAIWSLSDETFGTIENGAFVSNGKLGEVDIQVSFDGNVVGKYTITIMHPYISTVNNNIVVPYGKSTDIGLEFMMSALEGEEKKVFVASDAFDFAVEPAEAGHMEGFNFVASAETTVTSAALKATYKYGEKTEVNFTVSLGKGTEILWDFEEAEQINDFTGNAMGWPSNAYRTDNVSISYATAENGKVHDGSGALRFEVDVLDMGTPVNQAMRFQVMPKERYVIEGAKYIGAWVYIPNELWTPRIRLILRELYDDGSLSGAQLHYTMQAVDWYNHIEEGGNEGKWVYFRTGALDPTKKYVLGNWADLKDNLALFDFQWHASVPNSSTGTMFNAGTVNGKYTIYIDSIQVDYSDAVADREAPTITDMVYLGAEESAIPLTKNILNTVECEMLVIESNILNLRATIREDTSKANYTGIDYASAKILVDGVETPVKAVGEYLTLENYAVANGMHRITFVVSDKQGNETRKTRWINVVGSEVFESTIKMVPADPDLDKLLNGSVYWVNLNATRIETIQSVTVVIDKNSVNHWDLEHMMVAEGFTAVWSVDQYEETATITITRTGENTQIEDATLAQLPIRIIDWQDIYKETEKAYWDSVGFGTPDGFKAGRASDGQVFAWPQDLKLEILRGEIEFVESYTSNVANTFSSEYFRVNTLWYSDPRTIYAADTTYDWLHIHVETPVFDVKATCTSDGFEGRTHCEVCKSIVDYGTTVPAKGHDYQLTNGQFVCATCHGIYHAGTGLFQMNGDTYYAVGGSLVKNQWIQVGNAWYCFRNDYKAYTGDCMISNRLYHFGETGAITNGQWFDVDGYHRYYIGPSYYSGYWGVAIREIDGKEYGFDRNGDMQVGWCYASQTAGGVKELYLFGEDGVRQPVPAEPMIIHVNGEDRYVVNGELQSGSGLVLVDGDYYYVGGNGLLAKDRHYVSEAKSNGYGFVGYYDFDSETGKLIINNGIINGRYYVDGVIQYGCGLIQLNGDYYYIGGDGFVAKDRHYVSEAKSNGLGFVGYFDFDPETGKLILHNIIACDHYYLNNEIQYGCGLIKVGDDYYYIGGNGLIAKDRHYVSEAKSNGLGFVGYYDFDSETGKMIIHNGIVDDRYYIDGVAQYGCGLIQIGGAYYYIGGNGLIAKDRHYISEAKSNGHGFVGYYDFDPETGKMIIHDVVVGDHYYLNSEIQYGCGLIKVGDDYYYIGGNGLIAKDRHYISEAKSNGYGFVGYYDFDPETGKMIMNDGIVGDHYYINGVIQYGCGLIKVGDDYYYIGGNGFIAKDRHYISEAKSNGYGFVGYYDFDPETGKMIMNDGIVGDHYYINGVIQYGCGLIKVGDDYYYIGGNGFIAKDRHYISEAKSNGYGFVGYYDFDPETGKMILDN